MSAELVSYLRRRALAENHNDPDHSDAGRLLAEMEGMTPREHVADVFRILRSYEHGGMVDSREAERAIMARLSRVVNDAHLIIPICAYCLAPVGLDFEGDYEHLAAIPPATPTLPPPDMELMDSGR